MLSSQTLSFPLLKDLEEVCGFAVDAGNVCSQEQNVCKAEYTYLP